METETIKPLVLSPVVGADLSFGDLPGSDELSFVYQPVVGQSGNVRSRKVIRTTLHLTVAGFALIGFVFTAVFVSMQFGLLNVRGSAESRDQFFSTLPKSQVFAASVPKQATATSCVAVSGANQQEPICTWNKSAEWQTVRAGLIKDKEVILKVSQQTGVPARMIAASVAPEQLRFFTTNRETYKRYFEPLKILGSLTQFSLGIGGLKDKTVREIEQYTIDKNSPFYAGDNMASLISYSDGVNTSKERYNRITDDDHYYSYLYVALFIKELQAQWASAGYDISDRPDVITTLYNIGFKYSNPKPNPQIGGTAVALNGENFSYGELGTNFYRSDELTGIFARP